VVLVVLAVIIVGASLWYSNYIVNQIKEEERQKVQLWSEAVKKRLSLINYTERLFEDMRQEERLKVDVWAKAVARFLVSSENDEIVFLQDIMVKNYTIPVVITDENNEVLFDRNIDSTLFADPARKDSVLAVMGGLYNPIKIELAGIRQKVYYQDSRIITELEQTLDDLINSFISETVLNSGSVPVLFTDSTKTQVIQSANIDTTLFGDSTALAQEIQRLSEKNDPIRVRFGGDVVNYIFYSDSVVITQLKYYPYVQMVIVGLFLLISYLIFSTFRNAEQNQVWIGMAKETAHQLGTPLSSLMAWVQLLESQGTDKFTIAELNKDIERLETITDRFSKIGSNPDLKETDVKQVMDQAIGYLRPRLSSKVLFEINQNQGDHVTAMINEPLFGWVIENLFKNAVDAMAGNGKITVDIYHEIQHVYIDITDSGKGISSANHKAVFQPGFTTKKRGWGLGLSLAKRIIENYHSGKIFIKRSEPDKGTTFRIVLKTKI
jgi:signal transduction histidine kinase